MILTERIINNIIIGNLDFLDYFRSDYIEQLIQDIREYPNRVQLLYSSFDKILNKDPHLAFMISCDISDYEMVWRRCLESNPLLLSDYKSLLFFLMNVTWASKYVSEHLEKLISNDKSAIFAILRHFEKTGDNSIVNKLAYHYNLNIRGMFLEELIDTHAHLLFEFNDDILEYFVKRDDLGNAVDLMNEEYVSKVASLVLLHGLGEDLYERIKLFIFTNYEKNTLAAELDCYGKAKIDVLQEALISDINKLFITSKNYKYVLANRYSQYIDYDIVRDFKSKISPFTWIDRDAISTLFLNGLGDKFLEYVDKYLEKSTGSKVIRDAGFGTCSRVFRVGDYVIKCSDKKWSMEDSLCPSGYLFAKNYEEDIIRANNGEVTGAIEVQKYLTRPLVVGDYMAIFHFQEALKEMGYYTKDVLTDREGGSNCYYLDSYLDADCDDPEALPEWFKKDPVVLVDRDLIFRIDNRNPKIKAINLK